MERQKNVDYTSKDYWNDRYCDEDSFEWISSGYGRQLEAIAETVGDKASRILVVGCGNSNLSADLHARGFTNMTSMDFSEICIEKQRAKNPQMDWRVMDVTCMQLDDGAFDAVIEKATVDAFLANERSQWDVGEAAADQVDRAMKEISRILRPGGRFISLSFAQPHFRLPLYAKSAYSWDVVDCRPISEADAFAYYFYATEKGKVLNWQRLVDEGLCFERALNTAKDHHQSAQSSEDEEFMARIDVS